MRLPLRTATLLLATAAFGGERPPNAVFLMADELAYFELSHMGNPRIETPRIDRMAAEGVRFTRAYAGSPVCAPLRCNLMTGKHAGHASVRANDGGTPLRADETTIARLLKDRGYATGGFGKWGCGGRDSTGVPEAHGFDVFFGYYDQVHAHSFYPPYLVRNSEEVPLAGNVGGRSGETYSHYAIMDAGLEFIRAHRDEPFFCYLPVTPPHGMYDIPADDPAWELYRDAEWMGDPGLAQDVKNYAAMVSLVDRNLGQVLDLLEELELAEDTIVFFTGDNGGQDRFRSAEHPRGFFGPNVDPRTGVEFRGGKGNLYEGGLRIPFLARWPGRIEAGRVSEHVLYQPDVLPTLATLCGAGVPEDVDGLSFLPALLGEGVQPSHEFLYWEFGNQLAVRVGDWKGVLNRKGPGSWDEVLADGSTPWELYDLARDPSEANDVAGAHPDVVARLAAVAAREFTPARPGTYTDPARTRHERDRAAKWGTAQGRPRPRGPVNTIDVAGLIPAASLRLVSFSSENASNGKLAANSIDGDPRTVWHSSFSERLARPPHELVIDLGAEVPVRGFRYLARQDGGWNGAFAETEFWLATTPGGFGDRPDARATLVKSRAAQAIDLAAPVAARYVRVRARSEVNGNVWGSAAEIGIVRADTPEGPREAFLGEPRIELQPLFADERFPNVVVTRAGTVLATWGSANVRARRSEDGGATWGAEIAIGAGIHGGGTTVDETTGDVLAFVEAEHPPAPIAMYRSRDDGGTWRAEEVAIAPDSRGNAPSMHMNEHGITLRHGEHPGRLVRPSRWYAGENDRARWPDHYTNAIFSDDGGATWRTSEPFPENGTGEAAIVELSDGRLYYNSRVHWDERPENTRRRAAWSDDGGETWTDWELVEVLPDGHQHRSYGCMGGLVRLPIAGEDVLVFSNLDTPNATRERITVWASFDGGATWPVKRLVFDGPSAYSSLAAGRPGTPSEGWIYLHFEGGPQGAATVARFNLSWLLRGEGTGDGEPPPGYGR